MIIKDANVFEEGQFVKKDIYIQDGIFSDTSEDRQLIEGAGLYAIPGLTDLHFHGCMGHDFCEGTPEAFRVLGEYQLQNGITTMAPATMTYDELRLQKICEAAAAYKARADKDIATGNTAGIGADLVGINMEGPFLSVKKKGAQNEKYIQKTDVGMFRRLQSAANGLIKLVDIAPEEEGAMSFIDAVKEEVAVSIAHTTADYEIAKEAYDRGACHATHLYNAMPPFTHRAPGVIGAACDSEHVRVELITDGIHIHPAVVRTTFKMFGDDRIVLISDSMMAAGLNDGDYTLGGQAVMVKGKTATLADGTIAGSVTNLMDCLRTAVKEMEIPLASAVKCAAVNPAKVLGTYDRCGSIEPGKIANLVLLDENLEIKKVIHQGRICNGQG